MAKSSETAQLEEVKSLLHQLQRIRFEQTDSIPPDKPEEAPDRVPERPETAPSRRKAPVRLILISGAALVLLGAIAGASHLLNKSARQNRQPPLAAVQQPADLEPLARQQGITGRGAETSAVLSFLQEAQQLMLGGDILGARKILMKSADSGPPDVALALARSYDPNFLRTVTNPNAGPDVEQAALWYRRWHQAAVENGQITDTLRLERILRAMH